MSIRLATKTVLCLTLSALAFATAAYADSGYQPYYQQDRASLQYSNVTQPKIAEVQPAPASNPGHPVNWQSPQVTTQSEQPTGVVLPLGTLPGVEAGLQASYYRYNEPSPDIKITGTGLGATIDGTVVFGDHMFNTLDFRFASGRVDYNSIDGTSKDHENTQWEIRDVIGKDFAINNSIELSPFIGVGYRSLYNDSRGTTSLGYSGYQRDSEYLYIPIGIKPQFRVNGTDRLTISAEYDYFIHGWQTSHLGDVGSEDPTVHNGQDSGIGVHASAMWETGNWAFGPFINYWNINDSALKLFNSPNASCGGNTCSTVEPRNMTVEGGLQLKYRFLNF